MRQTCEMASLPILPVCWHEAGHALTALVRRVPMVRIRADESGKGRLEITQSVQDTAEPDHLIEIAAAGKAASDLHTGEKEARSEDDWRLAYSAMLRKQQQRIPVNAMYWEEAVDEAKRFLSGYFCELDELAGWICARKNTYIAWATVEREWHAIIERCTRKKVVKTDQTV